MPDELPRDPTAVRATFERIARHFDATRANAWPAVEAFVERYADGGTALDLGCGNGRHLERLLDRADRGVGIDLSRAMLVRARNRLGRVDLVEATASAMPVADRSIDLGLYIATLHHLPDRRSRVASLDELERVLTPSGRALVSVWSVAHDRFDAEEAMATTVDWTLPDGTTVPRFYFVYDRPSFDAELAASQLRVDATWEEAGNLYAHVHPPA